MSKSALRVCLTGGGTAGHVMPNLALFPEFMKRGIPCFYVGSYGMEKNLVEAAGIEFFAVQSGKLRRYFSLANLRDIFLIGIGFVQALAILLMRRPDIVFSKGGFVSVPVCYAAWLLRIPVVTHESDLTPGLATRLNSKVAKRVFYTFPETEKRLPKAKAVRVGLPIRGELLQGSKEKGLEICRFPNTPMPRLLVMGGSQGAKAINDALLTILPRLVEEMQVIHLTGKGKQLDFAHANYAQFEYVSSEYTHLLALSDVVLCRAGANSIFELLALAKPMLLIPLVHGSRGDQVDNAASFAKSGYAQVLAEQDVTPTSLQQALRDLLAQADNMRRAMQSGKPHDLNKTAVDEILSVL
jgi:UDP-N-acetylglucosamine--N-acetylmuramyl-(pentapeptide) pyrophosphoryl-undecaprenol N-acetylglucosamine transferase